MREWTVVEGDCIDTLRELPESSIDAIVCDPPYGIAFMQVDFDTLGDGPAQQAWHLRWCLEAYRILKPGGYLLAFGGTRTYHRLACAVEDAGFEIRDSIASLHWVQVQGFPKSLDISKAIDKSAGAERKIIGRTIRPDGTFRSNEKWSYGLEFEPGINSGDSTAKAKIQTAPATPEAKRWKGWGSALKPSHEPVVVGRKPLVGTLAANVLKHGTGGLNIDGCRVATSDGYEKAWDKPVSTNIGTGTYISDGRQITIDLSANKPTGGRWPPNLVFTHLPGCRRVGERQVKSLSGIRPDDVGTSYGEHKSRSMSGSKPAMLTTTYADPDDTETVTAWNCEPGCPVAELDRQSGVTTSSGPGTKCNRRDANGKCQGHENPTFRPTFHADERSVLSPDTGGASRMFPQFEYDHDDPFIAGFQYVAKPSTAEREAGLTEENMLCACGTPPSVEVESTTTPVCPTCRKWLRKPKGHEAVHREEGTAGLDSPRAGAGRTAKTRWCVHPTVKPIGIMRWLVRLVTPPNGTVLDPFCGSGTTGAAAMLEGCDFIGCEREPEYAAIARARIAHWKDEAERRDATPDKPPKAPRKPRAPKVATEPPAPVVAAPPPPVERAPEAPRPTATPATPKRRRPAVDAPDAPLLPFASPPRSTP